MSASKHTVCVNPLVVPKKKKRNSNSYKCKHSVNNMPVVVFLILGTDSS